MLKTCSKCDVPRDIGLFRKGSRRCRFCKSEAHRKWTSENRERAREINEASRARHPNGDRERYQRTRAANPEYTCWKHMNSRCHNPRSPKYPRYGGRGISVHHDWRGRGGFQRFLAHIGKRPGPEWSVDRIDNDRGYEPGNVRWATAAQQSRNTSQVRRLSAAPDAPCLADAAASRGMKESTLRRRLARGVPESEALAAPVRDQQRLITVGDVTLTATEWSRRIGGADSLVSRRIFEGWDEVDAASAPLGARRRVA